MSSLCRLLLLLPLALAALSAGASDDLTEELLQATEQEGRAAAEAAQAYEKEYNQAVSDLEAHNNSLNGTDILAGQYRNQLKPSRGRYEQAFAKLARKVVVVTGINRDANRARAIAFDIMHHWRRELYGFANLEDLEAMIASRKRLVWLALVIVAVGIAMRGRKGATGVQFLTPLEVPAKLRRVTVPGLTYEVGWVTGRVAGKETWTETKQTVHHVRDQHGPQTYVTTDTVTKGLLYLKTHDGGEHIYNLHGGGHRYRPGNLVTLLDFATRKGQHFLSVFNHDTDERQDYALSLAHRTPWLLNLAVIGVTAYYGFQWAKSIGQSVAPTTEHGETYAVLGAAAIAALIVAVVHLVVVWVRNRHYRKRFAPKAKRHMDDGLPGIRQAFAADATSPGG